MAALDFYKFAVSPLLPSACRFYPTCSEYMREAVARYGVTRGVWLGLLRLGKCHPFHSGGVDQVPANPGKR
jgi:putative membrane protein insertion efficiency factor